MEPYEVRWGERRLFVPFPRSLRVQTLLPNPLSLPSSGDLLERALDQPIGAGRLGDLVRPGERIVVLINDMSRLYQSPTEILKTILGRLRTFGVKDRDVEVIVATGMHKVASEGEARELVGPSIYDRVAVRSHDCHDAKDLSPAGEDSAGRPIILNRRVVEADRIIVTGGIVFHSLAGFAGGGKSIVPGVAGYETIQTNHRLAFDEEMNLRPGIRQGATQGNPLAEQIAQAGRLVRSVFMVNVIPGTDGRYLGAVAGDLIEAHAEGCRIARSCFEVSFEEKAALVVANVGGYPRDRELYQSMKALGNAAAVTEEGGTIIFLSYCGSGTGPEEWGSWIEEGDRRRIVDRLSQRFSFPGFVALKNLHLTSRFRVILVSGLDPEVVRKFRMEPAGSLEEAFEMVGKDVPRLRKALFLPFAGATMPVLRRGA